MVMDVLIKSSLAPIMEAISQTIEAIIEIAIASNNVFIGKKSFAELSSYLEKILPLLRELNGNNISASEELRNFLEILNNETKEAKKLIRECSERNRFYLFVNYRSISKRIEGITKEIIGALSCIPFASLNVSLNIREDIEKLISRMQNAEFGAAIAEEEILEKIESGIQERNVDRSYANNLLVSIAKAVGVSTDRSALKKEFDEFKSEIENLWSRKDKAEVIQMDQIIALLERADVASSLDDREKKYLMKRRSLGVQPLEPLMSFYCPITREVMVDPVETPTGHTFERSAIEKWLSEADECPFTSTRLDTSMLRPNKTLRQSIEEWKERNTMIVVASLKSKLSSGDDEEVLCSLEQLKGLCEEREIHKEWVVLENCIPTLVELLRRNRDVRNQALSVLCLLAKDSDDAKNDIKRLNCPPTLISSGPIGLEAQDLRGQIVPFTRQESYRERIAKVENSIEPIVQFLGRRIGERKMAVTLLLELSKCESVRDGIGKVQGCILLLVSMLSNSDPQAVGDAKNVLDNLSYSDDNVILMAKNNYFHYLLQRLSSGSDHVKMTMARTLGEMELTDHNKSVLVECGVLDLLLVLVLHDDAEMKTVAIRALLNLSSLKKNGQEIIKKGAVRQLLDILYRQTSSQRLRELVAATIVHLALSTVPDEGCDSMPVLMLESGEDISELFSFSNLTVPALQQDIFRALHAMCLSPSADIVKSKLRECSAVQILFQVCEVDNVILRANAVKLLCCLTGDGDEAMITEHVTQTSIETLLKILRTSDNDEEIASALGTIANLPNSTQISEWLFESKNLPTIFTLLRDSRNTILIENAVGAIRRLTVQTSLQLQKRVAEAGVIPSLVKLLEVGTTLSIRLSAISLAQLSRNSPRLSRQISRRHGFWCFSPIPESGCPVHRGLCTVESSFCLVESGAIQPITRALRNQDSGVCEAALDSLLTLIDDEMLQNGCKVLDEANAIPAIIRLLSSPSVSLLEKVLNCLERIFRLIEYKQKYGKSAHMLLVDLTLRGNSRALAARILAQLNVLQDQSSYF